MKAYRIGCIFLAILLFIGCGFRPNHEGEPKVNNVSTEPKQSRTDSAPRVLTDFNRGAALLEQYKYAEAARTFQSVLDVHPDWTAARFNLGLAYFNMQVKPGAKSYLESARKAWESVLQTNPDHLHARFCVGLYYQYLGENERALEYFMAVREADPADPHVLYKCAETLTAFRRTDDAVKLLERTIAIDPGFISAVYRLAMQYQRVGKRDEAGALFNRFKKLKDKELAGGSFTVLKTYGTIGKYYMALDADDLPLKRAEPSAFTRILFSPEVERLAAETSAWSHAGISVELPGVAAGDIDDDGDIDLCITALNGDGDMQLWRNDGNGDFSGGPTLARRAVSPCLGDVDNDGDLDLWLGGAGTDVYLENDGSGGFQQHRIASEDETGSVTHCARVLDVDSDGDLDLLAFRISKGSIPANAPSGGLASAASSVYNNNRDGSFTDIAGKLDLALKERPVAAVVYDDFDNDRDTDFVIFPANKRGAIAWVNDRAWMHREIGANRTKLLVSGVRSATSGDPDKDGDSDLLVFTTKGIELFVNEGQFRFSRDENFFVSCGRLGGTGGQFADMDKGGDLDIVVADAYRNDGGRGPTVLINDWPHWPQRRFLNILETDHKSLLSAIEFKSNASCVVADFYRQRLVRYFSGADGRETPSAREHHAGRQLDRDRPAGEAWKGQKDPFE